MEIVIGKKIFENIISSMQPFIEKKDMSQITSHILIQTFENSIEIKATDYEIGLKAKVDNIEVVKSGSTTINGKKILDIVKRLKDDNITLKNEGDQLIITQDQSKFKLPTFNTDEFPSFPEIGESPKININSSALINSLKKITPSIDNNNPKLELNGALIDIKEDKINFVSTDTKRLSFVEIENENNQPLDIIIPKKAIIEIQKLFLDNIEIIYNNTNVIINSNNFQFFTKLINGKFPDYNRIIPKSINHNITLPKDKFVEALNIITSVSNDVKLTLSKTGIVFESLSQENSEAKTILNHELNIDNFTIAINSRHVLDFLSVNDTNEFTLGLNEQNLPFILKSNSLITIVMPIVL